MREFLQNSVESVIHQQDKDGRSGSGQGRVKGLTDIHGKERNSKSGKHLPDKGIVPKKVNKLGKDRVSLEGGCVSNGTGELGVHQDVGQEGLSLSNRCYVDCVTTSPR